MQRICRLICKICRICKQICKKICTKYDIKYATNMQNMQKNMQNMSDHKTLQVYPKICKICNKYAKYVSQNLICRICTPHFADGVIIQPVTATVTDQAHRVSLRVPLNSLDFPRPAGPRPETRLAGYKPKGVIQRLFPSNVATMLLRPMAPPRRGGAA
jgi:hypothetical protein